MYYIKKRFKNRTSIYFLFTVLIVVSSFTSCTTESNSKPASTKIKLYAGSKTPYQPNTIINTPVYDSLQPFYIAMVARHGSRYMSSPDEDIALKNLLQLVDKKNQLKPAGKKLLASIVELTTIQKNNYGELTPTGQKEHYDLGG